MSEALNIFYLPEPQPIQKICLRQRSCKYSNFPEDFEVSLRRDYIQHPSAPIPSWHPLFQVGVFHVESDNFSSIFSFYT